MVNNDQHRFLFVLFLSLIPISISQLSTYPYFFFRRNDCQALSHSGTVSGTLPRSPLLGLVDGAINYIA